MEKEREIAKKVCIACGKCKELKADCYLAKNVAILLKDYEKIPEGSVIVRKEELKSDSRNIFMTKAVFDAFIERAKKDMAKEIISKIGELSADKKTVALYRGLCKKYGIGVE